jgi:hypothetical protein
MITHLQRFTVAPGKGTLQFITNDLAWVGCTKSTLEKIGLAYDFFWKST